MSFMSKNTNWTEVSAAGGSNMIPAGGYVAKITSVEDVESKEYLKFTYDIAEGEHAGFFANEKRPYTHQFIRSYKDTAANFMRQFLDCVEASNNGFTLAGWNNNPYDLINKFVGVVIQREDYTNESGEDRARMNVVSFAPVDDIRNNRYVLPDPEDNRKEKTAEQQQPMTTDAVSIYDADIPFL